MIDRSFSAALTFCLLVAATLAMGSALLEIGGARSQHARAQQPEVIQLQRVEVTGKRSAPTTQVAKTEGNNAALQRVQ